MFDEKIIPQLQGLLSLAEQCVQAESDVNALYQEVEKQEAAMKEKHHDFFQQLRGLKTPVESYMPNNYGTDG